MKTAFLTAPVLLVPVLLGSTAQAAPPAIASFAPQLNADEKKFRDDYEQAMKIGAKAEMKRLIDKNTDYAVSWIIQTAEAISNSPNDVLFERMAGLRTGWKEAKQSSFCDLMERYFSLMDPTIKRERVRMRGEYDGLVNSFWANMEKKDGSTFVKLGNEITAMAEAFEEIEDWYYASQCWSLVGNCFDEELRGAKDADLPRACRAYGIFLEQRVKIGLRDSLYASTKPRYDHLVGLGHGPAEEGAEGGPGKAAGPVAAGNSITTPLTFELIAEVDAIDRPSFYLDELYPTWNSIALGKKDSSVAFPRIDDGPKVFRTGSAKVSIDVDGDGAGGGEDDVDVPMRGRLEPVVFETGHGAAKRKVAFLAATGQEKDSYQMIEVNLAPIDESVTIYVTAAGSMVGEVNGERIQIIDDDLNGVYGSLPLTWGHVGMTANSYQPEIDSMVIGKSKRAVPVSEFTKIGDSWYQLEFMDGGTSLVAHPVDLKTGTLELSYKGLKPDFVIVKGKTEKYANCFFDLTSDKEVEVPAGSYELYFGMVSKGKKKQLMKAVMVADTDNPTRWDVLADTSVEVELGAPFGFDFETTVDDQSVLVHGNSVCVVGRGGERYERIWNAVPQPEASVRKAGSKRGGKAEDMPSSQDQQLIYDEGWAAVWFPRDLELDNRAGPDAEVQLIEKKNKLFGKIESVWK